MQANNVNHAVKRVSSDEIKQNYTQITGREALERLLAGEEVFSVEWAKSWKIIENEVQMHHCESSDYWEPSDVELRSFLDTEDNDWYVAPPFDARKEMLARPGEWVAKYKTMNDDFTYLGFDKAHMVVNARKSLDVPVSSFAPVVFLAEVTLDQAIPLDDADLAKLAALKADEVTG